MITCTWEPQEVLGNAQVAINEFIRAGSTGNAARRPRRAAQDDEYAPWCLITPWKFVQNWLNFEFLKVFSLNSAEVGENTGGLS